VVKFPLLRRLSHAECSACKARDVLGREIDGVVLTASAFDWAPPSWRKAYDSNLSGFDFSEIAAPLLMVHRVDDQCVATEMKNWRHSRQYKGEVQ
jgi:hypothetical protein